MSTHGSPPRSRHAAREATSRDTHASGGFDPTVGGMPFGVARDGEQSQLPDLAPESVDGTIIAPGAVDGSHIVDEAIGPSHIVPASLSLDLFAEGLVPPRVVDSLDVLPGSDWEVGATAFLTTDGKLYRLVNAEYEAAVLETAPLAYWRLGEAMGTTFADASGNGRTATLSGLATLGVPGLLASDDNKALLMDGSNTGELETGWTPGLFEHSVAIWFRRDGDNGLGYNHLFQDILGSSGELYVYNGGYVLYQGINDADGSSFNYFPDNAVKPWETVGAMHFLVATYDGATMRVYVDGAEIGPGSDTVTLRTATTQDLKVGRITNYKPFGVMDEPAVWGRALDPDEVARLYSVGASGLEFTAAIESVDLVGQITGVQIADNSISTPKLQALAITSEKIAAGAVEADKIAANSITSGQIEAGAIGADEIAAGAITTEKFHVGAKVPGVENSTSEVLIDDTGITILNGKLTFADRFGFSVLDGAGFGPSWIDFIGSRVYNAAFAVGSEDLAQLTVSEVGSGASENDYANSLSTQVPYWVIRTASGSSARRRIDADAVGGYVIEASGATVVLEMYQDVPISAGRTHRVSLVERIICAGYEMLREVSLQYRDATHAAIGTEQEEGLSFTTTTAGYHEREMDTDPGVAPSNARYLRVKVTYTRVAGSPTIRLDSVRVVESEFTSFIRGNALGDGGSLNIEGAGLYMKLVGASVNQFVIEGNGAHYWGDGLSGSDVSLSRGAANRLDLASGDDFRIVNGELQVGDYPNLNSSRLGMGTLELRGTTPYIDFSNDTASDYDARIVLESDDIINILGITSLEVNGSVVRTVANHAHGNASEVIDMAPSIRLNSAFGATTAVTLLASGAPAGATHAIVRLECESTAGSDANALSIRSGDDSSRIIGVAAAGSAPGYKGNSGAVVPLNASGQFYYQVTRGAGNVTGLIVTTGYIVNA